MNKLTRSLVPAMALCLPLATLAQPAGTAASASAPPLQYRSAFADYKPWQDIKPADWRALNESVKGSGMAGMAGHSMGASAPAAAGASASAAAGAASAPMPGHSGHRMHGGKQ
jgi:hypothetical protein